MYWLSPYLADPASKVGCEVDGYTVLPNAQPLIIDSLEDTGIYIIDNGQSIFLVIFNEAQCLYEVFGVETIDEVANLEELPVYEELPANLRLHSIIAALRGNRGEAYQDVRILTPRSAPLESFFEETLVEEEYGGVDGYGNFLAYLHRMIQSK